MHKLLVLAGPTASGKTALSLELAAHFKVPVISADARQFYREMQIGTARPAPEALRDTPHYLLGHKSVTDAYTAADFEAEVHALLPTLYQQYPFVILCGGSGLFIQAVIQGLDPQPEADLELRKALQIQLEQQGVQALANRLLALDPQRFEQIDTRNPQRLMRAIEISTALKAGWKPALSPVHRLELDVFSVLIDLPRAELYNRINQRVLEMMQMGLLEEVKSLLPFRNYNALQTVGYSELFDHLAGHTSLDEAVALIQQHTRNYAKRQLTWFRKFLPAARLFLPGQETALKNDIQHWLNLK